MTDAPTKQSPAPFAWAHAYLADPTDAASAAAQAARTALAELLEHQGFPASAHALVAETDADSVKSPAASPADAALVAVITSHGAPVVPSVNSTQAETARFYVTSTDMTQLAASAEREFGAHGVDAELRLFLDEALAAGDCYLDAAPGLGFAALSAASCGQPITVRALLHETSPTGHASAASDLATSARLTGVDVRTHGTDDLEDLPFEALAPTAYVIVHAGDAGQVAPLLSRLRQAVRDGVVGAVAWRRNTEGEATAAAVLDVLGFTPFALVDGAEGMELVPAEAVSTNDYVLSLTDAFIARQPRPAADAAPVPQRDAEGYTDGAYIAHHARALFDAIAEDLSPGSRELGRTPTRSELALAQLEMAWPSARVVSFDVFDTLLTRRVATPSDVFLLLADRTPFASLGMEAAALAALRRQAERDARLRVAAAMGSGEVTLTEIHRVLAERLQWDASQVPDMVDAEQAVELDICEAHPTLNAWFERARRDRKTLWCLSDTYHDSAFLRTLLAHCGYDMREVLVVASSEARCSKGEGRLFLQVLASQQTLASHVLHIGDHDQADDEVPAAHGIVTVLHPWAAARPADPANITAGNAVALGMAARVSRCFEPPAPFWWRFGYGIAGPLLSGFALWLSRRFDDDAIDRAYFLLRDGEILLDVYKSVVAPGGRATTSLLESSRRAFALPAFEAQRPSLLAQLTVSENPRPVREFFTRMGLSAAEFEAEIRASGFSSADVVVLPDDQKAGRQLARLMSTASVVDALRGRARDERALLLTYLEQEGVLAGGRVAFVDVGWNATIQRSLVAALETERRTSNVNGYYIGTRPPAHVGVGAGTVRGYLFEAGDPSARMHTVMRVPQLLEFVCSTTRGSLERFASENGRIIPVHGPVDHNPAQQEMHHTMRAGVMAFAHEFAAARERFGIDEVMPDAAMYGLQRLIERPTFEQAAQVGSIRHGDGLGSNRSRALAQFSPDAWSIGDIHRARKSAYWQAGLAGQYGPQALVLRTLQWLSQMEAE